MTDNANLESIRKMMERKQSAEALQTCGCVAFVLAAIIFIILMFPVLGVIK